MSFLPDSLNGEDIDEHLAEMMNLGDFCHKLKELFAKEFEHTYGLDKLVLGKNSRLHVSYQKGARAMIAIETSSQLRSCVQDQAKSQVKKLEKPESLLVNMSFGCATNCFIEALNYFQDDIIFEETHMFSQQDLEEPREKASGSKKSLDTKAFPGKLSGNLLRLHQDETSPIHHSFSLEHKKITQAKFSCPPLRSYATIYL